jgi:hypothetical protein
VDNSAGGGEPDPDANNAMLNGYVAPGGMGEFGKFQMHDNWKPDPQFAKRASQWGINLKTEITPFELAEFITYWKAEGKAFHHDQWQQKLARSVQQSRARPVPSSSEGISTTFRSRTRPFRGIQGLPGHIAAPARQRIFLRLHNYLAGNKICA